MTQQQQNTQSKTNTLKVGYIHFPERDKMALPNITSLERINSQNDLDFLESLRKSFYSYKHVRSSDQVYTISPTKSDLLSLIQVQCEGFIFPSILVNKGDGLLRAKRDTKKEHNTKNHVSDEENANVITFSFKGQTFDDVSDRENGEEEDGENAAKESSGYSESDNANDDYRATYGRFEDGEGSVDSGDEYD